MKMCLDYVYSNHLTWTMLTLTMSYSFTFFFFNTNHKLPFKEKENTRLGSY